MILYTGLFYDNASNWPFGTEAPENLSTKTDDAGLYEFELSPYARIVADSVGNGYYRIRQLISSDPGDYLKPEYAPGCVMLMCR